MRFYLVTFLTLLSLCANNELIKPMNGLENISLSEALKKLDKQNIELKVASFKTTIKEHEAQEASAHHWGSLDLQQNVMTSDDAGNVFGFKVASREVVDADLNTRNLNYPENRDFYQTKLTYKIPLFTGGKISAGSSIAQAMVELSNLDGKALKFKKEYELKKSFYDIALLKTFIIELEKIEDNLNGIEAVTKSMINEGYAKKIDLYEIKSKVANTQRLLLQSRANLKLSHEYVSFLLNEPVSSVDTSSLATLSIPDKKVNVKELSFVKKAALGVNISSEMTTIANAEFLPEVGAFAEVSSADNTFTGGFNDHAGYTIGVQLNWNLFSGMASLHKSQRARVALLKSNQEFTLAQKGLNLKIDRLKTQIRSLDAELISIGAELKYQEKIVENYRNRYAEKLSPITNVMQAESAHIQKVLEYRKTRNENNDKILQLHMLTQGL